MMRMMSHRSGLVVFLVCLSTVSLALPDFLDKFSSHYSPAKESALSRAKCATCHTDAPKRNPYGDALHDAFEARGTEQLAVEDLIKVETEDADGDGFSNIDEIKAGTLPGDAKSVPAASIPGEETAIGQEPEPTDDENSGGVIEFLKGPHSMHPLFVHFPIGIYLFGVFLEFFGYRKQKADLRKFAFWNLGFGYLSMLLSIITGVIATLRIGYGFEGSALRHLVVAVLATLAATAVVFLKRKGKDESSLYWGLLTFSAILLMLAGHLGAEMVHGS